MDYYVFTNHWIKDNLSLDDALELYLETDNIIGYKALGMNRTPTSACDIVVNRGINNSDVISGDYLKMPAFMSDIRAQEIISKLRDKLEKQ